MAFSERLYDSEMPFYYIGHYAELAVGRKGEYRILKVPVARKFGPNGYIKIRTVADKHVVYAGIRFVPGNIRIHYPIFVDKQDCLRKMDLIVACLDKFRPVFNYNPPMHPGDVEKREVELKKFAGYVHIIAESFKTLNNTDIEG